MLGCDDSVQILSEQIERASEQFRFRQSGRVVNYYLSDIIGDKFINECSSRVLKRFPEMSTPQYQKIPKQRFIVVRKVLSSINSNTTLYHGTGPRVVPPPQQILRP
eukprot:1620926-Rhodomonas_salina.1